MQSEFLKIRIKVNIKRKHLSIINKITCLPANTSVIGKNTGNFIKYRQHFTNILIYATFCFVFFSNVIRWRGDNKLD